MTKLLILLMGLLSTPSFASNKCEIFNPNQMDVLKFSYSHGKPFDLGYTLAAIAWRESSAGENIRGDKGRSLGYYHVLTTTAAFNLGIKTERGSEMYKHLQYLLKTDKRFSADQALLTLSFWKSYHNGDFRKMLSSYNAGHNWNGSAGQQYASDIISKVRYLKLNKCLED